MAMNEEEATQLRRERVTLRMKSADLEKKLSEERSKRERLESEMGALHSEGQRDLDALVQGWSPEDTAAFLYPVPKLSDKLRIARAMNARAAEAPHVPPTAAASPGFRHGVLGGNPSDVRNLTDQQFASLKARLSREGR